MNAPPSSMHPRATRSQVGGAALAGLVLGAVHSALIAMVGWWMVGRLVDQVWTGWIVIAVIAGMLTGAWFADVAVLRARGVSRARAVASWTVGIATAVTTVVSVLVGWLAIVVGTFLALLLWSGEYSWPIAVSAVVLAGLAAVIVSVSVCMLLTVAYGRRPATPVRI